MDNSSTSLLKVAQTSGLLSERITSMLLVLNWSVLSATIAVFGIAANIINIIVFIKMGVRESVNLSLLCLSLSDLGSLVVLAWISVMSNPLFTSLDLPFIPTDMIMFSGSWIWICFVRPAGVITAFVTMERCLCIITPLRVHRIFTPKKTAICLAAAFFLVLLSLLPVHAYVNFSPIFDVRKNKTLLGIVYLDNADAIEQFVMITGVIVTAGSVLCVSVFSAVLIHALIQRRRKWKCSKNRGTSQTPENTRTQSKDVQVAKMILLVAAVFLITFMPNGAMFLAIELVHEFFPGRAYYNLFNVCISSSQVLQGINSSINILLYIKMGSKFRRTARALFLSPKRTQPNLY
ncbi:putative G-protein coupled receptor F59B2.13 [Aplysia californica]|uniref:G-protein coupled receptor F59B2.13 n=1 Tax=Aplysia californica TaxID=6500 RepID=A0ABM0JCH3_APLCA|nr:putative G-protein coupled receptor F59B2.13 [Aplysia californica]